MNSRRRMSGSPLQSVYRILNLPLK